MHFRNYEKPEGWSKGQPEVLVTKPVISKLGNPAVNYDSLHQYLTDDFGLPYDSKTIIKLSGRFRHSILAGFHQPFTRTVHVNAPTSEKLFAHNGGTMKVLAHELRHRADSSNRKVMTAVDIAARWASFKVGYEVSEMLPLLSSAPVLGSMATRQAWYAIEPAEKRAREEEKRFQDSTHDTDIIFPYSVRAILLALKGRAPGSVTNQFEPELILDLTNAGVQIK